VTDEEFLNGVMPAALGTSHQKLKLEPELLPAVKYTPEAMVELIVLHPSWTPTQLCAHFGRGLSWFSSVLASDAFQLALDPRKPDIPDPYLTASMEERFRALALQSLGVLSTKLEGKEVSEFLATKAAEIGVKALGLGNPKLVELAAPAAVSGPEAVADRIMAAMAAAKARINSEAIDVAVKEVPANGS